MHSAGVYVYFLDRGVIEIEEDDFLSCTDLTCDLMSGLTTCRSPESDGCYRGFTTENKLSLYYRHIK